MTVVSTVVRAAAAWTGAETEIPTGIQVQDRSQLVVSLVPDDGERLTLSLGLHYTITLSPAGVATVVPLAAFPATPGTVSMVRQTPMTQVYDPTATDTYDAAGHAAALDRSAMRVAELSVKVDDIAASSIIVAGGASSVPAGAVYISDGGGGAMAGPTAPEIEAARVAAVGAAATATGAAGSAAGAVVAANQAADRSETAAALADDLANATPGTPIGSGFSARHWAAVAQALSDDFDLSNYWTTAQILAELESYVPVIRTIASGLGVKINGGASATLGGTVTIGLDLATDAETVAGLLTNKPSAPSGVHAAIVAALASFSTVGIKNVRLITASDSVTPSAGVTKWLYFLVDGGYNGSESGQGAQFKAGSGGPGGKGSIGLVSVDPATAYSVTIGARNGGATSIVVGGVTKTSTNGILNVPSAIEDSPALVFNASTDPRWARGGSGGPGPFGFGSGGSGATVSATSSSSPGSAGTGYGAGGAGGASGSTAGNTAGSAGSQGCLLILEF